MWSVKTWRRTALATYLVAGAALATAAYTFGTTAANAAVLASQGKRFHDARLDAEASAADTLSADTAAGDSATAGSGPVDWSQIVPAAVRSTVSVSGIASPKGRGENITAWRLPGVRANLATDMLTRYRAWQHGWSKSDQERTWVLRGAGFVSGDGLHVITAAHVVNGQESLRVRLPAGEWRTAYVDGMDLANDVGLLRLVGEPAPALPMAVALPAQGAPILAIGTPDGRGFSVSAGIVSRYGMDGTVLRSARFMQIDASIAAGSSGGVVVNRNGEAVGIVSFGTGMFTQIVPIDRVQAVTAELAQR